MFQHLLIPTDGSPSSESAARQAVALAARLGARVTALTVKPAFHVFTLRPEVVEDTRGSSWDVDLHARNHLAFVESLAAEARVPFEGVTAQGDHPWKVILETARERGCDAIAMASHGRSGLERFLVGSQTQRVLAHTPLRLA
ncbi:MAG: universal stress protein, partial [Deltaproteobacteria bacterium]